MLATTTLRPEQIERLRRLHPYRDDLSWMPELARTEGWLAVNRRYLHDERQRSEGAMRDLMAELGVERVASLEQAADLVELALQVFTAADEFTGRIERTGPNTLRVENADCAVFQRIVDEAWHGVTACPSWHRRAGWYDALGVYASDAILGEKKWGDAACLVTVSIDGLR